MQIVLALATLVMCVIVHELGHVFATLITGGVVAEIVVFGTHPHIQVLAKASGATQSLRIASGSGLVFLLWFVCGLISWGSMKWFPFKILSLFAGVELTGWLLSCLRLNDADQPNDATDFLASSGLHTATLITLILVIGATGALIMFFGRHRAHTFSETDPQPTSGSSQVVNRLA